MDLKIITRHNTTVGSISCQHFLPFAPALRRCMVCPDTHLRSLRWAKRQLLPIILLYRTVFLAPKQLVRDTAPVPLTIILYREVYWSIKLVPHTYNSQTCTRTGKTCAIPSCTVTNFWLKYRDSAGAASGTPTNFIAGRYGHLKCK